jgi:hypothetical protein
MSLQAQPIALTCQKVVLSRQMKLALYPSMQFTPNAAHCKFLACVHCERIKSEFGPEEELPG